MRIDSDPDLWKWYLAYRRRYFYRKNWTELPEEVTITWHQCDGDYGDIDEIDTGEFVIRINPKYALDQRQAKFALLHELVHLKLWPYKNHGPAFHKEMLRLAKLGAFNSLW
jgi:hypothetical protein